MKYTIFYVLVIQKYNIRTDVKIGIFPIPIACWSGFGISNQNWGNPDEIGMAGQSFLLGFHCRLLLAGSRRLSPAESEAN